MGAQVAATMKSYDVNGDGVIDFEEFEQLLTNRPWKSLLPPDVLKSIKAGSRRVSAPRAAPTTAPAPPSQAMGAVTAYLNTAHQQKSATVHSVLGAEAAAHAVTRAAQK